MFITELLGPLVAIAAATCAGMTGTAPGILLPVLPDDERRVLTGAGAPPRLDGGIKLGGSVIGTGSFSNALYTKCIAYKDQSSLTIHQWMEGLKMEIYSTNANLGGRRQPE